MFAFRAIRYHFTFYSTSFAIVFVSACSEFEYGLKSAQNKTDRTNKIPKKKNNHKHSVVLISVGSKKELRTSLDVVGTSPRHRASSIAATSSFSVDASTGNEIEITSSGATSQHIQPQLSLDQSNFTGKTSSALTTNIQISTERSECMDIIAESLEKIVDNKLVREKRSEMEKKLEALRKKHDKEKLRVTSQRGGDLTDGIRKSKFYMNNKLVKRLSNKNL